MGVSTRIGKVAAATYSDTVADFAVTYTTNSPSASTTATVADGDVITSAETGALFFNMQAQIDALSTDMAKVVADNVAMLAQLNAGE